MDQEYEIKKVPVPKIVFYIGSIFLIALGVEKLVLSQYLSGILAIVIGIGFYYIRKFQPKKTQSIMKINKDRLWTRNRGNKPWDSIICIKFRYEARNPVYMDIYISNDVVADEEISLHGINMSLWRLKRLLRRYVKVENH